jgi:hypothetical protein
MSPMSKTRLIFGCCLLLALFGSCRPRDILSRKEMASVLFDLHLTEAAVSEFGQPIPASWTRGLDPEYFKDMAYRSVLRKHNLTQETFYASVDWYSRHLNLYNKVYADVQERINVFQSAVDIGEFDKSCGLNGLGVDTAQIRSMYEYGQFHRDSKPVIGSCLLLDSMPSYSAWMAKQWMYRIPKDSTRMDIMPGLSIKSTFDTSNTDSLKALADSLIHQNDGQVTIINSPVQPNSTGVRGRTYPYRRLREVPKDEQIRNRFRPRAREMRQLKREEVLKQKAEKVAARKKAEEAAARKKAEQER